MENVQSYASYINIPSPQSYKPQTQTQTLFVQVQCMSRYVA
jgi:hypothetical protein